MSAPLSAPPQASPEMTEHSPEDAHSTKRRRIALACLDCRRRKLKCDRSFPICTRCQKSGHAASCIYDPEAVESIAVSASADAARSNGFAWNGGHEGGGGGGGEAIDAVRMGGAPPSSSFVHHHALDTDESALAGLRAHIYRLENRIIGLEKLTNDPQHRYGGLSRLNISSSKVVNKFAEEKEAMMFRGKSFKTQFFGASHNTSYLTFLHDLRSFMKDMVLQHPGLAHFQKEIKGEKVKAEIEQFQEKSGEDLVRLLPSKEVTDSLVSLYIDCFESTYRLLHLPTWYEEYGRFWDRPFEARPAFVALLVVMIAATSCLKPRNPAILRGDSSLDRESAIKWIYAVKSWQQQQSQKHVTLTTLQINCVVFIAEHINGIKRKRTWTSIGTLSRLAMAAGIHRDAEILNIRQGSLEKRRVSLFDQEMRRRIWSTIAELELQIALERGMPAFLRDVRMDCGAPLNVSDDDVSGSMTKNPVSRPTAEFTQSSFLYHSHYTLALRQDLVSYINGSAAMQDLPYDEVLRYDRQLVQAIEDVPAWDNEAGLLPRVLIQLQLQNLLLLLHRPFVQHDSEHSRYDYSAMAHFRAALNILDLHQSLIDGGKLMLCIFRHDMVDAAFGVCYNFSISNPASDNRLVGWSSVIGLTDPLRHLENGLSLTFKKMEHLGVGIQECYCIISVIGLYKKLYHEQRSSITPEHDAAERVAVLMQKTLAQQDDYSAAATLASLPTTPRNPPTGGNGAVAKANGVAALQSDAPAIIDDLNRPLYDVDLADMSGWDLEAFFNF